MVAGLAERQEEVVSHAQLRVAGVGRGAIELRLRNGRLQHLTPTAFETDRARDAHLTAAGYRVIRITWRQLAEEPHEDARILEALLR